MLDWGVDCVEYLSGCSGGGHGSGCCICGKFIRILFFPLMFDCTT